MVRAREEARGAIAAMTMRGWLWLADASSRAAARIARGYCYRKRLHKLGLAVGGRSAQLPGHWASIAAIGLRTGHWQCLILIGALGLDGLCAAMTVAVATARRSYSVWSTCQTCRGRAKRVIPDAVVFRTVQRLNSRSNLADQTSAAMTSPNSSQFLPLQR
jgi:hypothetical protein